MGSALTEVPDPPLGEKVGVLQPESLQLFVAEQFQHGGLFEQSGRLDPGRELPGLSGQVCDLFPLFGVKRDLVVLSDLPTQKSGITAMLPLGEEGFVHGASLRFGQTKFGCDLVLVPPYICNGRIHPLFEALLTAGLDILSAFLLSPRHRGDAGDHQQHSDSGQQSFPPIRSSSLHAVSPFPKNIIAHLWKAVFAIHRRRR